MGNKDPKTQESTALQESMALESDGQEISRLLGELKRVEVPGDFEFRVRARIVTAKLSASKASWLPISVRIAVPLGLLLLIGGYFAFNTMAVPDNIWVPAVVEVQTAGVAPVIEAPSGDGPTLAPSEIVADRSGSRLPETVNKAGRPAAPEKGVVSSGRPVKSAGGGSFDAAGRVSRRILPKGFDLNQKSPLIPGGQDRETQITAVDILTLIGIKAAFSESGWKVESVTPNNIAGRSGVKAGDVIEALNDQPLAEKTAFGG